MIFNKGHTEHLCKEIHVRVVERKRASTLSTWMNFVTLYVWTVPVISHETCVSKTIIVIMCVTKFFDLLSVCIFTHHRKVCMCAVWVRYNPLRKKLSGYSQTYTYLDTKTVENENGWLIPLLVIITFRINDSYGVRRNTIRWLVLWLPHFFRNDTKRHGTRKTIKPTFKYVTVFGRSLKGFDDILLLNALYGKYPKPEVIFQSAKVLESAWKFRSLIPCALCQFHEAFHFSCY